MISFGWSLLKFGFIWTSWQAFVCLPLELTHTHAHTHGAVSHIHWLDHKLGAGLGPCEKVTQSSAVS